MKRLVVAALVALTAAMAPGLSACARPDEEALIMTDGHDAEVNAAIMRARSTLPVFWGKFDAQPPGYSEFAVKVGLKTGGGGEEHIWMDVIRRADGVIEGELVNEPYDLGDLKIGSRVKVDEAEISDWQYSKGDKLYGHFTTRALLVKANAVQRAQAGELFSPQPLEVEAQ